MGVWHLMLSSLVSAVVLDFTVEGAIAIKTDCRLLLLSSCDL